MPVVGRRLLLPGPFFLALFVTWAVRGRTSGWLYCGVPVDYSSPASPGLRSGGTAVGMVGSSLPYMDFPGW
jgi:hypothetical protein